MPQCICWRYCNGGQNVPKATHNKHAAYRVAAVLEADKAEREREKVFASARDFADKAIGEQDRLVEEELSGGAISREPETSQQQELETLQVNLANMVLAGESTGVHTIPGGRLWSHSGGGSFSPSPPPPLHPRVAVTLSKEELVGQHYQKLAHLKDHLSRIGQTVALLSDNIFPNRRREPFPIQKDVDDLYSIWHSLERTWENEGKGFRKARLELAGHAVAIIEELKPRQSSWRAAANEFPDLTSDGIQVYDASYCFNTLLMGYEPAVQLCLLLVVALQVMTHASRRAGQLTLAILALTLKSMLGWPRTSLSTTQQRFIDALPDHPETVGRKFNLETKHTIYAVCPNVNCHKLYKPSYKPGSVIPLYPKHCDYKEYPHGPSCGTILTNPVSIGGRVYHKPIKRFVAFDLKDWISRLLSQPGCEEKMDKAWSRDSTDSMNDVFDGDFLKNFMYKDGKPFSHPGPGNQARYVLSMSVDFFNPQSNSAHSISCGIISLVNFNLLPEERYRAENVFLAGIIPGPKEPSVDAMNHYFVPIVNDLKSFWDPGVYISRTANHEAGRLVILALILLICDLPAARKTAGVAGIKHNQFCSVCHVTLDKEGYGSTDYYKWERRTNAEYLDATVKYRAAEDERERKTVFNQYAVRWSAFSELGYFDMRKSLAVDAMHNLFLGMLREQSNILGIGIARGHETAENLLSPEISLTPPTAFDQAQRADFALLQKYLQQSLKNIISNNPDKICKKLATFRHASLQFMVEKLGCNLSVIGGQKPLKSMTKDDMSQVLFEWRKQQREWPIRELRSVLEEEELETLGQAISDIVKPTWLTSLPSSLGTTVKVKLKADQWRVFGTVFLPLALIKMWRLEDPTVMDTPNEPRAQRLKDILDGTFYLVQAILIATSGTMNGALATMYVTLMLAYMEHMKKVFPMYKFKPNNHMSLHLAEHLQQFGPVHSWWTFPFERVIGMVQRIPTNNILGQLEETMAFSFHRSSNLRNLFRTVSCPPIYSHASPIFDRLFASRNSDILVTGILKASSLFGRDVEDDDLDDDDRMDVDVPDDNVVNDQDSSTSADRLTQYTQLFNTHYGPPADAERRIIPFRTFTTGGIRYSGCAHHMGNSLINFSSAVSNPSALNWGQIQHFLSASNTGDLLVVIRRFKVADEGSNPFEKYPFLRGQLLLPLDDSERLETITTRQIISHFAYLPVEVKGKIVFPAISLSRRFELAT